MSNESISRLSKFKYESKDKVRKPIIKAITRCKDLKVETSNDLDDLNPSLDKDLVLLFVGFNPGIESSKTQHHYAHHTNLF